MRSWLILILLAGCSLLASRIDGFAFVARVLAVLAGFVLLATAWEWRRPRLRLRVARFTKAVRLALQSRVQVLAVHWLGSPSSLEQLFVRVVVATDAERTRLQDDRFDEEFERLLEAHSLPPRGHAGIRLRVDSQQTVDRDFDGSWQLHDQ